MTALTAVLVVLATHRLTLLVVADKITEPPRDRLEAWAKAAGHRRLAYLVTCPWCASPYVALPVAWTGWCWGTTPWWTVGALVCAASSITGTLASWGAAP